MQKAIGHLCRIKLCQPFWWTQSRNNMSMTDVAPWFYKWIGLDWIGLDWIGLDMGWMDLWAGWSTEHRCRQISSPSPPNTIISTKHHLHQTLPSPPNIIISPNTITISTLIIFWSISSVAWWPMVFNTAPSSFRIWYWKYFNIFHCQFLNTSSKMGGLCTFTEIVSNCNISLKKSWKKKDYG